MIFERKILGESAEEIACQYLQSKGFEILERNFKCKLGEIDIIVKSNIKNLPRAESRDQKSKITNFLKKPKETIIFVEVKAKTLDKWGWPEEMVNKKKQDKIVKCGLFWLKTRSNHKNSRKDHEVSWRVDVVAIEYDGYGGIKEIKHIENAVSR